jgi:hypothetical protein
MGYLVKVTKNSDQTMTVRITKRDGTPHPDFPGSVTAEKKDLRAAFTAHAEKTAAKFKPLRIGRWAPAQEKSLK